MHKTNFPIAPNFSDPSQVFTTVFEMAAIDALQHGVTPAELERALNRQIADYLACTPEESAALHTEISPRG